MKRLLVFLPLASLAVFFSYPLVSVTARLPRAASFIIRII
jgi:hypothetical protein